MIYGDINGIVEGYLTESVNGSNIYNQLDATWRFNRLKNQIFSGNINLNGTMNYQNITKSTTEIYVLQTSVKGTTQGHYSSALDTVITHVGMINGSYKGEGFSIISYVSNSGSGEGWTYDKISLNKIEMNGMFTDPLLGIVSGTLDENKNPRELTLSIERLDIGMTPMADLKVKVWGPERISPGQTVDYIIEYRNDRIKSADNVILIYNLPDVAEYISSTGNGIYVNSHREVVWRLYKLPPTTKEYAS